MKYFLFVKFPTSSSFWQHKTLEEKADKKNEFWVAGKTCSSPIELVWTGSTAACFGFDKFNTCCWLMMLGMCCWIALDTVAMSFSSMLVVLTEKKTITFGLISKNRVGLVGFRSGPVWTSLDWILYDRSHRWSSCGDSNVGDFLWILVSKFRPKWPKPSPTSYSCHIPSSKSM